MSRELKHILIAAAVVCCAGFLRCANRMTPQGGPKDSLPPVVKLMTPANGQRHFAGKRIFIEFDEYVALQDQSKEFFSSPLMKYPPTLSVRERGVRIDIRDTLRKNQTYALNFGNSVRDNNEGNILYGLRYVFSTGPGIDSMIMTGYAADAAKSDSVSKAFVFFFDSLASVPPLPPIDSLAADSLTVDSLAPADSLLAVDSLPTDSLAAKEPLPYITAEYDSLLLKGTPSAVARAENNGIFIAQNLKDVPYRIYAVQDNNGNQAYDPGVDKVGFLDSLYNPADPALPGFSMWLDQYRHYPTADPQLYFRLFTEAQKKRQNLNATERPGRHQAILRFNAPFPQIDTLRFDSIPDDKIIREYMTPGRDTMSLWFDMPPAALPDTIKGRISYLRTDSMGNLSPAGQDLRLVWRYVETRDEQREREKEERDRKRAEEDGEEYTPPEKPNPFKFKVDAAAEVNPEKSIPIEFDLPLVAVDSVNILLFSRPMSLSGEPTGEFVPAPMHIVRDTMNIRKWVVTADWNEELAYHLMIPAGAFVDIAGERNDTLKSDFKIQKISKFATLNLNLKGKTPDAKYLVQVVNSGGGVIKEIKGASTGLHTLYYIPEGEVQVRITEDVNGNGKWDSGSLVERRQPERTEYYVGPTGSRIVPTRSNWEVDVDLDMAQIFAPVSIQKIRRDLEQAEDARVAKWMEGEEERAAERKKQEEQEHGGTGGGLGFGSAMGGARQQIQSGVGSMGGMGGGVQGGMGGSQGGRIY